MIGLLSTALAFPFEASETTLANGMSVVLIPMDTPGAVSTHLSMSVGARNDIDAGRSGFAHFFEHLVFSDTAVRTRAEREVRIVELGTREAAYTGYDRTQFGALVPSPSLDPYLGLLAESFVQLRLTEDVVRREAGAVYGEWRKAQGDPETALFDALARTAYTVHPYRYGIGGTREDIAAMPQALAYAETYASRWYRPQNARLVLAGDVDASTVDVVRRHFEGWAKKSGASGESGKSGESGESGESGDAADPMEPTSLALVEEPEQLEPRRTHVQWSSSTSPLVVVGWKVPPARIGPDRAALQAVAALLFGSGGALTERLVREEGLAHTVWGGSQDRYDTGLFTVYVRAAADSDPARIERILIEEIERLGQEVPDEALQTAKTRARYRTLTRLDRPEEVASTVARRLALGSEVTDLDAADEHFAAVDATAVRRVIDAFLVPERSTTVVLTEAP